MYPFPDGAGEFQAVLKHHVVHVDVEVQGHTTWNIIADIFAQWCEICLRLSVLQFVYQLPSQELGARKPTRRTAEKRNSGASSIWFTCAVNLSFFVLF